MHPGTARRRRWPRWAKRASGRSTLVASVSDDNLERVHSTLMSPLVWDLGHIAAFEDLWLVHRHGGRPLLREDLAAVYDAFETPRAGRGDLPFLRPPEARDYLEQVRERVARGRRPTPASATAFVLEMVVRHEHQHNETMLQTIQLAQLTDYELDGPGAATRPRRTARAHRLRDGRGPGRPVHDRRARRRASPMTTSGPATAPTCAAT